MLAKTSNNKLITLSWTSVSLYIPLITENFSVAPTLSDSFTIRHAYPLQLNVSHTRLWESIRSGRLLPSHLTRRAQRAPEKELRPLSYTEWNTGCAGRIGR